MYTTDPRVGQGDDNMDKDELRLSQMLDATGSMSTPTSRSSVASEDVSLQCSQQFIGVALTRRSDGEPSRLYKALRFFLLLPIITGILPIGYFMYWRDLMRFEVEPTGPELYVTTAFFVVSWCSSWVVLRSARLALAPEGSMNKLLFLCSWMTEEEGRPRRRLTKEAHASLAWWQKVLKAIFATSIFCALGVGYITIAYAERMVSNLAGVAVIFGFSTLSFILTMGWMPSMWLANKLCQDRIGEVINKVQSIITPAGAGDVETGGGEATATFDAALAGQLVKLDEYMRHLSRGWGSGMLGLTLMCWGWALGFVSLALNTPFCEGFDDAWGGFDFDTSNGVTPGSAKLLHFLLALVIGVIPCLAVEEIVKTSERCHEVMGKLNKARMALLGRSTPTAAAERSLITETEAALAKLNFGGGLGFVIPFVTDKDLVTDGFVVNRWTVRNVWIVMITSAATIYTALVVQHAGGSGGAGELANNATYMA